VEQLAYSPDGGRLAVATHSGGALILDAHTGRRLWTLGTDTGVTSVAWSPDGKALAVGSHDERVRIVDPLGGKVLSTLQHQDRVTSVAYSPDGRWLASAGADGLRIWDVKQSYAPHAQNNTMQVVLALAFPPDGAFVAASATDNQIHMLSLGGSKQGALPLSAYDQTLVFSDKDTLLCGDDNGLRRRWSVHDSFDGPRRLALGRRAGKLYSLTVAPRAGVLATASSDGVLTLWNAAPGRAWLELERRHVAFRSVAFSPRRQGAQAPGGKGAGAVARADRKAAAWPFGARSDLRRGG
jgi:WD40 repeat protein